MPVPPLPPKRLPHRTQGCQSGWQPGDGAPTTTAAPAKDLAKPPTPAAAADANAKAAALPPRPRQGLVVRRVFPPNVIDEPPRMTAVVVVVVFVFVFFDVR